MKRVGSLDVDEDLSFQTWEWRIERIGWFLLLLVILGALIGVFGSGPISKVHARTPDQAVSLEYCRIVRQDRSEFLQVHFHSPSAERRIAIATNLMNSWNVQKITPEPASVVPGQHDLAFHFAGTGPGRVVIEYRPSTVGKAAGTLSFGQGQTIKMSQTALP
jgi:hypothetical protein